MTAILQVLAGRGLFFLDSRTSADERRLPHGACRWASPPPSARSSSTATRARRRSASSSSRLLALASTRGAAVAIGHPHPETLAVLQEEVPKAKALGYEFVPVSYLLDREGEPE